VASTITVSRFSPPGRCFSSSVKEIPRHTLKII
jgi:hypothetical protein